MLDRIVNWIGSRKIFLRKRKSNEIRALGMLLYRAGLSYQKAGDILNVSNEAVREWYCKGRELFTHTVMKRRRRRIAIDKKEIRKNNGIALYLWAAVDIDTEEVIAVYVSYGRNYIETLQFLRNIRCVCKGKHLPRVFVDGGSWYPWALQRMGFNYSVVHFGPRSAIERFFSLVDWRIRRFWERFPNKSSSESLLCWAEAFAGFTNLSKGG
ncbi:MAG: DDE-type integrase/transposase/recombinase [Proteobacteria bacterium]|nr:DDE-type integrase/transposase/recombinase [Pseudomonadota bacterium]MCG2827485.1 DDE-type integrase/transposase/recombinase [Thermoplasmatales archaeon]